MEKIIVSTSSAMESNQNTAENNRLGLDAMNGNSSVSEKTGENNVKPEEGNSGTTKSDINIKSNMLSSKLGNGDCFHNPENLVQFVVSGEHNLE
jgi:hypothetical protein